MTDILTRLAALTTPDEIGLLSCPKCAKEGVITLSVPSLRYHCHCIQNCIKTARTFTSAASAVRAWNALSRDAALIALVQEAAGEIERLQERMNELEWHRMATEELAQPV